jgi:hypothetical protein
MIILADKKKNNSNSIEKGKGKESVRDVSQS